MYSSAVSTKFEANHFINVRRQFNVKSFCFVLFCFVVFGVCLFFLGGGGRGGMQSVKQQLFPLITTNLLKIFINNFNLNRFIASSNFIPFCSKVPENEANRFCFPLPLRPPAKAMVTGHGSNGTSQ